LTLNPDVVLVWGDDQYENFRKDIIPAFCVMAYDGFEHQPMAGQNGSQHHNVWDEPADKIFTYKGHESARYLAGALLEDGFDIFRIPTSRCTRKAWATPLLTP
jgi:hypothetical protein